MKKKFKPRKTKTGFSLNKNGVPLNKNGGNAMKGCNYALFR